LFLLLVAILLDFITGIIANYNESKRKQSKLYVDRYFLQSSKLRLSILKFITYGLAILIAFFIEYIFMIGEFKPHHLIQKVTFTTIVISFCCAIEIYSIFFENIKRMGFDIILKIKEIITQAWKLYKILKGEKENE